MLAAGTCGAASSASVRLLGWRLAPVSLPVSGRLVRMLPGVALVASGSRLYAAWDTASGWSASAPLAARQRRGVGQPRGGRGMGAAAGPARGDHRRAGAAVAHRCRRCAGQATTVLAPGPGGAVDALAVGGSQLDKLTVWRLAGSATAWSSVQTINVPIQFGSSS